MYGIRWLLGKRDFFSTCTEAWPLSSEVPQMPRCWDMGTDPQLDSDTARPRAHAYPLLLTPTGASSTLGKRDGAAWHPPPNNGSKRRQEYSQPWGAWVAQSVKRLTSAQVMISQFVGSSPASGSVLTARSLEPVSDSASPSLPAPPLLMLSLSVSQK